MKIQLYSSKPNITDLLKYINATLLTNIFFQKIFFIKMLIMLTQKGFTVILSELNILLSFNF